MKEKIIIPIFIYKDTEAVKKVIDMLNENSTLSKQEIYSKLSRRRAKNVWAFLQDFNQEVNNELLQIEKEVRSLFTFRKVDSINTGKHWEVERNYTINSYEINGGYRVEIILK